MDKLIELAKKLQEKIKGFMLENAKRRHGFEDDHVEIKENAEVKPTQKPKKKRAPKKKVATEAKDAE